jgi:hypothetical protein
MGAGGETINSKNPNEAEYKNFLNRRLPGTSQF